MSEDMKEDIEKTNQQLNDIYEQLLQINKKIQKKIITTTKWNELICHKISRVCLHGYYTIHI